MIDTIIFDLDGVLINSKDIHFEALNSSLSKNSVNYQISYEDHLKSFDGLPTKKKLEILNQQKIIRNASLDLKTSFPLLANVAGSSQGPPGR